MKGLKVWFQERFPPVNFISGMMLYILPKCIAHLALGGQAPWKPHDLIAAFIPGFHLFILRVFDEHKDYQTDLVHHPNRALQRGVVSLREIRSLGLAAGLLEFVCLGALSLNGTTWLAFAISWIWTLLMWKEFFAADWLKRHYFWYGLSHLMITPFILLFCALLANTPSLFLLDLFGLGLLTSWIYEVSRKTKAPEEETGDISYSKMWGLKKSSLVIVVQGMLIAVVGLDLYRHLGLLNAWALVPLSLLVVLHVLAVNQFAQKPSPKGRKSNEGTSALIGFAVFLTPLVADLIRLIFR